MGEETPAAPRILVVDDDPAIARLVLQLLHSRGFNNPLMDAATASSPWWPVTAPPRAPPEPIG